MRMEVNVSEFVWVMLTRDGEKTLDEYIENTPAAFKHPVMPSHLIKGPGGWSRFRLDWLMDIFGAKRNPDMKKPQFVGDTIHFIEPTYGNGK